MKKIVIYFASFILLVTVFGVIINSYSNRIKNYNEINSVEDGKIRTEKVLEEWKSDFEDVLSNNGSRNREKLLVSILKTSQGCGKKYVNLTDYDKDIISKYAIDIILADKQINNILKKNNTKLIYDFINYDLYEDVAIIDVFFDRATVVTIAEVKVNANNIVLNSAKYIKEAVSDSNVKKVELRIKTSCRDDYGKIQNHVDVIPFNLDEINEFRNYNTGEDIAYNSYEFKAKLNLFWNSCTPSNPSSLVY